MSSEKTLLNKAYKYVFGLTAFFLVTALIGAAIGGWIDAQYNIKPLGTLGTLVVFYAISWVVGRIILKRFSKNN